MKSIKSLILTAGAALMGLFTAVPAMAQYMPVVYDNTYGSGNDFVTASADFSNGDIVLAGTNNGQAVVNWLDGRGESRIYKTFAESDFVEITAVVPVDDGNVLITGYSAEAQKGSKATGHAMVVSMDGTVERDIFVGVPGTKVLNGAILQDGSIVLSGSTPRGSRNAGFVCKVSAADQTVYMYAAPTGAECRIFNVQGSRSEFLYAAFSSEDEESCVVRLDENGTPYYITTLADDTYVIENMVSTADGYVYLTGHGAKSGGTVVKLRPEGDVVFNNPIVPVSQDATLAFLTMLPTGELFVGGHGDGNAYYGILRSDGTSLVSGVEYGEVLAVAQNLSGNQVALSVYDYRTSRGKIIKLNKTGRKLYERVTAAPYSVLRINSYDDLLMAAPATGRLSMFSSMGELLFDRYVQENMLTEYSFACLPYTGEAFFVGSGNQVSKLAHGVYVNDITVNKPIEGSAVATFTVNLTGFRFDSDGTPRPVTVRYGTTPRSAEEGLNFIATSGTLSFVPNADGRERYLSRYTVEVPVMSNDLLEGDRVFALVLSDATDSYLIRAQSSATIIDQPAVVRMIGTTPGTEGESDVRFELGIFKTNGVKLTNATGSDIVVDGYYGNGTADQQDFDMGRKPRLYIADGAHSGSFDVHVLEDTRYENVKTVVVDFDSVNSMFDTDVSFRSTTLSCVGEIYDQPAVVVIESLGDFNKMNSVVSTFFKISLLRAKDGALQTNCSGGDILLTTELDASMTAVPGTDFVLTNDYDLRIWGDDNSSATNLNGIVLYTPDNVTKTVTVNINGVSSTEGSGPISVGDQRSASFNINDK